MKKLVYISTLALLLSCTNEDGITEERGENTARPADPSCLITSVSDYIEVGEDGVETPSTRAKMDGTGFEKGDMMRLRIIAPFSSATEYGESTWSGSYDNWRLFEWHTGADADLPAKTGRWYYLGYNYSSSSSSSKSSKSEHSGEFDINNDYYPSNAPTDLYLPQATPYVFTATTWTEEVRHIIPKGNAGGTSILSFSNVFKADQRKMANFKSSDVLWAQSYVETGSENVFLNFEHKMASLLITIDAEYNSLLDSNIEFVLTLENMPDIDQQEVVIGNYYYFTKKSVHTGYSYNDWQRSNCDKTDNGKVLGICYVDQTKSQLQRKAFVALDQTGVYSAYKVKDRTDLASGYDGDLHQYLLIIPPYTVPDGITPTLCLRNGEKRWKAALPLPTDRRFESGKRYKVTMKKQTTTES